MEFPKMFKFDCDPCSSELYLNCFVPNLHKELQNHQDNILIEFEITNDQFNDGFIYCYEISNDGIDIVEEILKKHGFKEYT